MRRTASGRSTHPRSAATDQAANAKPTTAMLHGEFSREVSATRPLRGSLLSGKYSNAARARLSSNFPSDQPAIAVMADPRRPERAAEPPTGVVGTLVVPRKDLADLRSTVSMSRRRPWMACSNGVDLLAPVSVARYESCYRPRRHRVPASGLKRTVDYPPEIGPRPRQHWGDCGSSILVHPPSVVAKGCVWCNAHRQRHVADVDLARLVEIPRVGTIAARLDQCLEGRGVGAQHLEVHALGGRNIGSQPHPQ